MDEISVLDLNCDDALYPRVSRNEAHIVELVDALDMGAKLPAVIAWRSTKQVIDGFHRIEATKRLRGSNACIAVEWRDYANPAEAFADAVRLNADHGLRLRSIDHAEALIKAQAFGMTEDALSRALKVPTHRIRKMAPTTRLAKPTPAPSVKPDDSDEDDGGWARRPEPRPLAQQHPTVAKHPVLIAAGQRMDEIAHPQHDFSEAVKGVLEAKRADPDALWTHLLQAAAAALAWASEQQHLREAA